MIMLKTNKDIDGIRESSSLLVRTHAEIAKLIKPGVSSDFLDKKAEEFIRENGGVQPLKDIIIFLILYVFHQMMKLFMVYLIMKKLNLVLFFQ